VQGDAAGIRRQRGYPHRSVETSIEKPEWRNIVRRTWWSGPNARRRQSDDQWCSATGCWTTQPPSSRKAQAGHNPRRQGLGLRRLCGGDVTPALDAAARAARPAPRAEMVGIDKKTRHASRSPVSPPGAGASQHKLKMPVKLGASTPARTKARRCRGHFVGISTHQNTKARRRRMTTISDQAA